jgi:DNA repair exonuclease SbcCD ATPase subunit
LEKLRDDARAKIAELQAMRPDGPVIDVTPFERAVAELGVTVADTSQTLESARYNLRSQEQALQNLVTDLERAQALADKITRYTRERQTSTRLTKYLRDNRDRFMAELWGQITAYAGAFAAQCTGGAISGVSRSADGTFRFSEDGFEDEMVTASGSQRSIMSLGIQLALDTLLPDTLGALLLDEPTADMDAEHASTLTTALANANRQIIMVSHREMDAAIAQAHIDLG